VSEIYDFYVVYLAKKYGSLLGLGIGFVSSDAVKFCLGGPKMEKSCDVSLVRFSGT